MPQRSLKTQYTFIRYVPERGRKLQPNEGAPRPSCLGKSYSGHEHSFEGVIHALMDDPEGFTIEGFEDYYSQQEREMLQAIKKKLLQQE